MGRPSVTKFYWNWAHANQSWMQVLILVKHAVSVFTHSPQLWFSKKKLKELILIRFSWFSKNKKLQNSNNLPIKPLVLNGIFMRNMSFFEVFDITGTIGLMFRKYLKIWNCHFFVNFKLVVELREMPGIKDFLTLNWDRTRIGPKFEEGIVTIDPFNTQWNCSGCQLESFGLKLGLHDTVPY
jgi:hypothetical protein